MRIDGINKLQHALQTWAFSLAIATLQYAFQPEKPYVPLAAYSLAIGTFIWAIIDLGRHFFPSAAETGWPTGLAGMALVVVGIVAGYFLGNLVADTLCRSFGWYAGYPIPDRAIDLRNSVLITLTAGSAGTYYFYTVNKANYLVRKMTEARHQASGARLKLLETQLEPHMLFNTLANLRALIAVDPERAQYMLDRLVAYLRATLAASRTGSTSTHSLQAEFDRLRDYLELMTIRMGPRLRYTLDLPPALALHPVPPLLLQALVENSIQHGLDPKIEGGSITISARQAGTQLTLVVEDTGTGSSADLNQMSATSDAANTAAAGFGVAQVRERLDTHYGKQSALQFIAPDAGGTRATVSFPYTP